MLRVNTLSGPVPRGLRLTFVLLTLGTLALAVAAAVKGVWLLVVIAGVFAVCNLGILWTTRSRGEPTPTGTEQDRTQDV
jgi:beta-lactamase regulating signal transducer with metallopeptidase domain